MRCGLLNQTNNPIKIVSTNHQPEPPMNPLSEASNKAATAAKDVAGAVEDIAEDAAAATKNAAESVAGTAKDVYQSAAVKAGETLSTSKEYVRRNPVPVVLGAVAFGMAIGYMLMMARRKPTFGERYADEPLVAVREAIRGALAPVTQRLHQGYDSAREGAEKALDRMHRVGSGRRASSLSDQIGRVGNNLKFW